MEDSWQSRLRASVGDSKLWGLRRQVILSTALEFVAVGKALLRPIEADEETRQEIYAVGLLTQMAGEFALAGGRMLSDGEHYAGAALVRQLVEIEYLTWTIKEGHRSAGKWLQSTYDERIKVFSPGELRKTSKGRFLRTIRAIVNKVAIQWPRGVFCLALKTRGAPRCYSSI